MKEDVDSGSRDALYLESASTQHPIAL
jgi:hypothetical protein